MSQNEPVVNNHAPNSPSPQYRHAIQHWRDALALLEKARAAVYPAARAALFDVPGHPHGPALATVLDLVRYELDRALEMTVGRPIPEWRRPPDVEGFPDCRVYTAVRTVELVALGGDRLPAQVREPLDAAVAALGIGRRQTLADRFEKMVEKFDQGMDAGRAATLVRWARTHVPRYGVRPASARDVAALARAAGVAPRTGAAAAPAEWKGEGDPRRLVVSRSAPPPVRTLATLFAAATRPAGEWLNPAQHEQVRLLDPAHPTPDCGWDLPCLAFAVLGVSPTGTLPPPVRALLRDLSDGGDARRCAADALRLLAMDRPDAEAPADRTEEHGAG